MAPIAAPKRSTPYLKTEHSPRAKIPAWDDLGGEPRTRAGGGGAQLDELRRHHGVIMSGIHPDDQDASSAPGRAIANLEKEIHDYYWNFSVEPRACLNCANLAAGCGADRGVRLANGTKAAGCIAPRTSRRRLKVARDSVVRKR